MADVEAFGKIAKAVVGGMEQRKESKRREKEEERKEFRFQQEKKRAPLEHEKLEQDVEAGRFAKEKRPLLFEQQQKKYKNAMTIQEIDVRMRQLDEKSAILVRDAQDKAAQQKAQIQIANNEKEQAGLIYDAFRIGGGKAAAHRFNTLRSNGVQNAADVVIIDREDGTQDIAVVDSNGNPVIDPADPGAGPAIFSLEHMELMWGVKDEKGTYSYHDKSRVVLNTKTGKTRQLKGGKADLGEVDDLDKFLLENARFTFGNRNQAGQFIGFSENQEHYANAAKILAKRYYAQTDDFNLSWFRAVREIRAKEQRDLFTGELESGPMWGQPNDTQKQAIAQELTKYFIGTEPGVDQLVVEFLAKSGIEDRNVVADIIMHFKSMKPAIGFEQVTGIPQAPQQPPMGAGGGAPPEALQFLQQNPNTIDAFEQKFGYRPPGF